MFESIFDYFGNLIDRALNSPGKAELRRRKVTSKRDPQPPKYAQKHPGYVGLRRNTQMRQRR